MQGLGDEMVETRVAALARLYTVRELEALAAFRNSPAGQAYERVATELPNELMAAFRPDEPVTDEPAPSAEKLALINRVLKAQDVEGTVRKGWRALNAMKAQALKRAGMAKQTASFVSTDKASEDAFVKRCLAIETRYYARTFPDDQLTVLAAFFEGPMGHAAAERKAKVEADAASEMTKLFEHRLTRMGDQVCTAVGCSGAQRAALDSELAKMRSQVAGSGSANAH
jgi:hypothetical protein